MNTPRTTAWTRRKWSTRSLWSLARKTRLRLIWKYGCRQIVTWRFPVTWCKAARCTMIWVALDFSYRTRYQLSITRTLTSSRAVPRTMIASKILFSTKNMKIFLRNSPIIFIFRINAIRQPRSEFFILIKYYDFLISMHSSDVHPFSLPITKIWNSSKITWTCWSLKR